MIRFPFGESPMKVFRAKTACPSIEGLHFRNRIFPAIKSKVPSLCSIHSGFPSLKFKRLKPLVVSEDIAAIGNGTRVAPIPAPSIFRKVLLSSDELAIRINSF
ncbi:MAG TPA: hypothetical protein DIW50_07095 [Prolixibacteraceae bacterium]|nr:hypothetical protein [Prolixibacteraceae bacterium]